MDVEARVAQLRDVPLFSLCSDDELAALAEVCAERTHAPGDVLFRQGDPGDECIVVLEGRVVVRAAGTALGVIEPGESVGEMALIEQVPRSATAEVVDELRCLAVPSDEFSELLGRMPSVARGLLVAVSRRLRDTQSNDSPWA